MRAAAAQPKPEAVKLGKLPNAFIAPHTDAAWRKVSFDPVMTYRTDCVGCKLLAGQHPVCIRHVLVLNAYAADGTTGAFHDAMFADVAVGRLWKDVDHAPTVAFTEVLRWNVVVTLS